MVYDPHMLGWSLSDAAAIDLSKLLKETVTGTPKVNPTNSLVPHPKEYGGIIILVC